MKTSLTLTTLLLSTALFAQDVQKCCGTSNSTFLLGNTSYARHTQSLYLPGDLTNAQSGTIDRLYFRYGSTGEELGVTLSNVMIRLALTPATSFVGGNTFYTNLDTVLMTPELIIAPGLTGEWFSFPIDPFQYDAGRTLILDIWFEGSSTTNFGTYGSNNNGRKLYAIDLDLTTGSSSSSTWQDFGFDVDGTTSIAEQQADAFQLIPLPGHEQWKLSWNSVELDQATMQLRDATGRLLREERVQPANGDHLLDMAGRSSGIYFVQLRDASGIVGVQRFLKP
ncbi:MAG: T9SS type A sorting domain-containing protein [Flavobacteriales bacterium]